MKGLQYNHYKPVEYADMKTRHGQHVQGTRCGERVRQVVIQVVFVSQYQRTGNGLFLLPANISSENVNRFLPCFESTG